MFLLILRKDSRRRNIVSVYTFFVGESETRGFQFVKTDMMQAQQAVVCRGVYSWISAHYLGFHLGDRNIQS